MKQSTILMLVVGVIAVLGVGYVLINSNQSTTGTETVQKPATQTASSDTKTMEQKNIVQIASQAGSFNTLVAAVTAADLVETLSGTGPFTVFAPTDEAFAKLPAGTVEALLKDKDKLTAILTFHVVPGKVMASEVVNLKSAQTVSGQELKIAVEDGKVMVNGAQVVTADIQASNGVIHVIDTVLLPK